MDPGEAGACAGACWAALPGASHTRRPYSAVDLHGAQRPQRGPEPCALCGCGRQHGKLCTRCMQGYNGAISPLRHARLVHALKPMLLLVGEQTGTGVHEIG